MRGTLPLIGGTDGESKSFSLAPGGFARRVQFLRVGSSESGWDGCRTKGKGRKTVWSSSCWDGTTFLLLAYLNWSAGPSGTYMSTWRNGESLRVRLNSLESGSISR